MAFDIMFVVPRIPTETFMPHVHFAHWWVWCCCGAVLAGLITRMTASEGAQLTFEKEQKVMKKLKKLQKKASGADASGDCCCCLGVDLEQPSCTQSYSAGMPHAQANDVACT